ncbi:hypothetical protein KGP17_11195 [Serratia sp. JSRIV001]|uniref:hypothetical protein n=1 Tax=unclassified Serratia (in: enterobacteria) TaxID=2647522 RepID=UPI001CBC52D5|nr:MULTISPECIES: hypothetical protein [unclassified Serratia (in: enterobacteria)]UAN48043.1 hypothetical protein KGP17_11195 [Serratia sp. JSRIV001]UAN53824.1 hypothetical protein KGP26_12550 [Serratia sp. JSRIV002]UAN65149.1 hypothetical protein KGP16_11515 [Serratia sp. JSRIV006]
MIYDFDSHYISDHKDGRFVRYDVIKKHDDAYLVKVFDEQQKGIAEPKVIIQVDEFELNRSTYMHEYGVGDMRSVKVNMPPTFDGYLRIKCQDHRNKLD